MYSNVFGIPFLVARIHTFKLPECNNEALFLSVTPNKKIIKKTFFMSVFNLREFQKRLQQLGRRIVSPLSTVEAIWLASVLRRGSISHLIRGFRRWRRLAVFLLVSFQGGRFSLRNRWGLLCFYWTAGDHVLDALAEVAPLGLGW